MGDKIFTIKVKGETDGRDNFKACASYLSEERRLAAEDLAKKARESMTEPVAIFRTIYNNGGHRRYRLCGIYEVDKVPKKMAKIAIKYSKKGSRIIINSDLGAIAKNIRKLAKKKKKKVFVDAFNRSPYAATILIV